MNPEAIKDLVVTATQAETSKLVLVFGLVLVAILAPVLGAVFVTNSRTRAKIAELQAQGAFSSQQAQDSLTSDQSKSLNNAFASLAAVLSQQHQTIALQVNQREQDFAFHENYLELARRRTAQFDEMKTMLRNAGESQDRQNQALMGIESVLDRHIEASTPALATIAAIPVTLQRIEALVIDLDTEVETLPDMLAKSVKDEVAELRRKVEELAGEIKKIGAPQVSVVPPPDGNNPPKPAETKADPPRDPDPTPMPKPGPGLPLMPNAPPTQAGPKNKEGGL